MSKKRKFLLPAIVIVSITIPIVVAILYFMPKPALTQNVSFLPAINACINGIVTVILIAGFIAIRNKRKILHRNLMITAFILSILFLLSYITYHSLTEPTEYGGGGILRYTYYFILITHITLAATVILPMVLITLYRGLTGDFVKHKKIARWTLPLWLYVTITGVLVYLMISPYY